MPRCQAPGHGLLSHAWCQAPVQKNGWLLPGLRRHGCARNVEQVLDLLDAPNLARALLEILDHRRLLDLAAEDDDAVLRVDVDLPLRHTLVAEDLGLDLARKRDVVRLRLLLFFEVLHLLLGAVDLDRKSTRLNSSHVAISYAVF